MKKPLYKVYYRYTNIDLWRFKSLHILKKKKWRDRLYFINFKYRYHNRGRYLYHFRKLDTQHLYAVKFNNKQIFKKYFSNYDEASFKHQLFDSYLNFEKRLDYNIYQTHFVTSFFEAKFLIKKGFVYVNNCKISNINYILKKNDLVEINPKYWNSVKNRLSSFISQNIYTYLINIEFDYKTLSFIFLDNAYDYVLSYNNFVKRYKLRKIQKDYIQYKYSNSFFNYFRYIYQYYLFNNKIKSHYSLSYPFFKKKKDQYYMDKFAKSKFRSLLRFIKYKYNNYYFKNLLLKNIFQYKYNYLYTLFSNHILNNDNFYNLSTNFKTNLNISSFKLNKNKLSDFFFKYYINIIFQYYIYLIKNYYYLNKIFKNLYNFNIYLLYNYKIFKIIIIQFKLHLFLEKKKSKPKSDNYLYFNNVYFKTQNLKLNVRRFKRNNFTFIKILLRIGSKKYAHSTFRFCNSRYENKMRRRNYIHLYGRFYSIQLIYRKRKKPYGIINASEFLKYSYNNYLLFFYRLHHKFKLRKKELKNNKKLNYNYRRKLKKKNLYLKRKIIKICKHKPYRLRKKYRKIKHYKFNLYFYNKNYKNLYFYLYNLYKSDLYNIYQFLNTNIQNIKEKFKLYFNKLNLNINFVKFFYNLIIIYKKLNYKKQIFQKFNKKFKLNINYLTYIIKKKYNTKINLIDLLNITINSPINIYNKLFLQNITKQKFNKKYLLKNKKHIFKFKSLKSRFRFKFYNPDYNFFLNRRYDKRRQKYYYIRSNNFKYNKKFKYQYKYKYSKNRYKYFKKYKYKYNLKYKKNKNEQLSIIESSTILMSPIKNLNISNLKQYFVIYKLNNKILKNYILRKKIYKRTRNKSLGIFQLKNLYFFKRYTARYYYLNIFFRNHICRQFMEFKKQYFRYKYQIRHKQQKLYKSKFKNKNKHKLTFRYFYYKDFKYRYHHFFTHLKFYRIFKYLKQKKYHTNKIYKKYINYNINNNLKKKQYNNFYIFNMNLIQLVNNKYIFNDKFFYSDIILNLYIRKLNNNFLYFKKYNNYNFIQNSRYIIKLKNKKFKKIKKFKKKKYLLKFNINFNNNYYKYYISVYKNIKFKQLIMYFPKEKVLFNKKLHKFKYCNYNIIKNLKFLHLYNTYNFKLYEYFYFNYYIFKKFQYKKEKYLLKHKLFLNINNINKNKNKMQEIFQYYMSSFQKYQIIKYIFTNYIFNYYSKILDMILYKKKYLTSYNISYLKNLYYNILFSKFYNYQILNKNFKNKYTYKYHFKIMINYLQLILKFYK